MKMYTIDGQEVILVRQIEEGYLGRLVYNDYSSDEEQSIIEDEECSGIQFFDKLYEHPPTEKLAGIIVQLTTQRDVLSGEVSELRSMRLSEEGLVNRINRFPVLQALSDYLTGDFSFYLDEKYLKISAKSSVYHSQNIKAINNKGQWQLYKKKDEGSDSFDDTPFSIFKTREQAIERSKEIILQRFANAESHSYGALSSIKQISRDIDEYNEAKQLPEVKSEYEAAISRIQDLENAKRAEELKKQLEEFDQKRQELTRLQNQQS